MAGATKGRHHAFGRTKGNGQVQQWVAKHVLNVWRYLKMRLNRQSANSNDRPWLRRDVVKKKDRLRPSMGRSVGNNYNEGE